MCRSDTKPRRTPLKSFRGSGDMASRTGLQEKKINKKKKMPSVYRGRKSSVRIRRKFPTPLITAPHKVGTPRPQTKSLTGSEHKYQKVLISRLTPGGSYLEYVNRRLQPMVKMGKVGRRGVKVRPLRQLNKFYSLVSQKKELIAGFGAQQKNKKFVRKGAKMFQNVNLVKISMGIGRADHHPQDTYRLFRKTPRHLRELRSRMHLGVLEKFKKNKQKQFTIGVVTASTLNTTPRGGTGAVIRELFPTFKGGATIKLKKFRNSSFWTGGSILRRDKKNKSTGRDFSPGVKRYVTGTYRGRVTISETQPPSADREWLSILSENGGVSSPYKKNAERCPLDSDKSITEDVPRVNIKYGYVNKHRKVENVSPTYSIRPYKTTHSSQLGPMSLNL